MRWPWQRTAGRTKTKAMLEAAKQNYARASAAVAVGRLDDARQLFEKAAELVPEWAEAHINAGSLCYQLALGSLAESRDLWLEKAEQHFVVALRRQPESVTASLNLAATLNARGKNEEALAALESLAEDFPETRDVHYNLALALLAAGRVAEAREEVSEELGRHPDHAAARVVLDKLEAETDATA